MGMTEVDDFIADVLPRMTEMDEALHNGDAGPRKVFWSHKDPVTLFGAVLTNVGWPDIEKTFDGLAARFSDGTYEVEVIASGASGDLGYLVAIEHTSVSVAGAPPEPYELRVTTILRREGGEWKIVHRHADPVPGNMGAISQTSKLLDDIEKS
jgi:ketosteroid isomerase-like protein